MTLTKFLSKWFKLLLKLITALLLWFISVFAFTFTKNSVTDSNRYWNLILLLWAFSIFIFEAIFWRYFYLKRKRERTGDNYLLTSFLNTIEKAFDYRIVLITLALTYTLTFKFVESEHIKNAENKRNPKKELVTSKAESMEGFWVGHTEILITFLTFLAIVGAVYAIYAKRKADDSFDAAKEIIDNITSFFTDSEELMNTKNERGIPKLIENSENNLKMFLGSPLVGYFRSKSIGNYFYELLVKKLEKINQPFKISLLCWSDEYIDQEKFKEKGYNVEEFREKRDDLFNKIRQHPNVVLELEHPEHDSAIRFVISDDEKAIFWILEDPSSSAAKKDMVLHQWLTAGFTTGTKEMIKILRNLFIKTHQKAVENREKRAQQSESTEEHQ